MASIKTQVVRSYLDAAEAVVRRRYPRTEDPQTAALVALESSEHWSSLGQGNDEDLLVKMVDYAEFAYPEFFLPAEA
jgi:hypothetical protein